MQNKILLFLCYLLPLINIFTISPIMIFISLCYCMFIYKIIGKNNLQLKEHSVCGIKIMAVLIAVWTFSSMDISWFSKNISTI